MPDFIEELSPTCLSGSSFDRDGLTPTAFLPTQQHASPEGGRTVQRLPIVAGQEYLWRLCHAVAAGARYNISIMIELPGDLQPQALQQALHMLINHHEIWRASFPEHDGIALQEIQPFTTLPLRSQDIRSLPAETRASVAHQLALEDAQRPFDLSRGPLLRGLLLRLADQHHRLYLTWHRLIYDEVSLYQDLLPELRSYYEACCTGRLSSLAPPNEQYTEYVCWLLSRQDRSTRAEQRAFWRQQLYDASRLLDLPADHPCPPTRSLEAGTVCCSLNQELSRDLKMLASQAGTTLYRLLLASFVALLHRYAQQDDLVIGAVIDGRQRCPEFAHLAGYLRRLLPLRISLTNEPDLQEVLRRIETAFALTWEHQDVSFEDLLGCLPPGYTALLNPLFQVTLKLTPPQPVLSCGWSLTQMELHSGISPFDLALELEERADGTLVGRFIYSRDCLEETVVTRLSQHWLTLLRALLTDPACPISRLPLLSAEERQQVLVAWNPPHSAQQRAAGCIQQLFEEQARRTPQACALDAPSSSIRLSYDELNRRANRLAHFLRRQGIGADIPVPLCLPRSPELLIALLAVLKAGGAYVPLDPYAPGERLQFMLEELQAPLILSREEFLAHLPTDGRVLALDTLATTLADEPDTNPDWAVNPEQLAYIIYTSGSTGQPKGTLISHANLWHSTQSRLDYYAERVRRFLLTSPFTFDSSVAGIFGTLCQGGTLVLPAHDFEQHLDRMATLVEQQQISHLLAVPSLYRFLLEQADPGQLDSLRCVIVAGETCSAALVQRHYERLPMTPLFNEYGPTEASVWSSVHPCLPHEPHPLIPIGRPLPHSRLYVLDPSLQPVPIGVPGELFIGGPSVARGYLQRPTLTSERFLPDPFVSSPTARMYRTGDRVRWRPDGSLVFLGRLDQQVKLRGYRIELGEIEAILTQHPSVREAAVIVREDPQTDPRLVAYVVARESERASSADLREYLSERLPAYMIPAIFFWLTALPLNANGKVDRSALPIPEYAPSSPGGKELRTSVEARIEALMCALLQLPEISSEVSFFSLGGNSLLGARLVARISETFGIEFPLGTLFKRSTLRELAAEVDRRLLQKIAGFSDVEVERLLAQLEMEDGCE